MSNQKGRAIRYNKKFAKDRRYMGIWSLMTTGNIINKKFSYYEVPFKLDKFDEEQFEKSNCIMYATLTNVETGKPEYFKVNNVFEEMELLRATSAMPFVSKMVEWKGKKYLDGGISDSIPIKKCQQLGYDKIIVVTTRTIEYRKKRNSNNISKLRYMKYPNLIESINNRYKNYNNTVERIIDLENKKEIFVIRPSCDLKIKRIERNRNKLQQMYDLGLKDCESKIKELDEYLYN